MLKPPVRFLAYLAASAATFSTGLALAQNSAADTSRELVCRGAQNAFVPSRWDDAVAGISKLQLNFSHSATAPGADGQGMQPGTCAWTTGVMSGTDLHQVNFVENPGGPTVEGRAASSTPGAGSQLHDSLNDPNRFWRFTIDGQQYGWYLASDHGPWQPSLKAQVSSTAPAAAAASQIRITSAQIPSDLFKKPADEQMKVGQHVIRAGDLQQLLKPAYDALGSTGGNPNVSGVAASAAAGTVAPSAVQQVARPAAGALGGIGGVAGGQQLDFAAGQKLNCDKEPPTLSRVLGKIRPGAQFTLLGFCLGRATGRIDAHGQFPGGRLAMDVVVWRDDLVVVTMPELSAITDQQLVFSATRGDGEQSAPIQSSLRTNRVSVNVPPSMWRPKSFFEDSSAGDGSAYLRPSTNRFQLSINPACELLTMDSLVTAGAVTAYRGFENGPPHQADVEVDAEPACKTTNIRTDNGPILISDWDVTIACRVRYDLTAVASCPAGISP